MQQRSDEAGGGFSVLDGVALVAGAAVGSVQIKGVIRPDILGAGWLLVWGTFAWIALTSAGPFVYIVRRYARRVEGYPKIGDWLWALLGLPWLITALCQTSPNGPEPVYGDWLAWSLTVGIGLASMISLAVVWRTWVMVTPEASSARFSGPWTNYIGLILAIAWPIQCGAGMVVMG